MSNFDDEKYSQQLLHKYLTFQLMEDKNFPKEEAKKKALELIKKSDNIFGYHGLAWRLGSKNLEYFCMFFLANVFNNEETAPLAKIHKDIWKDIQNVILNENTTDQQGYILPRGTGKSVFGGLGTSVWSVFYGYKKYILVCSSTGQLAEKFIKQMKVSIEDNERLKKAFGNFYDSKNKDFSNNATQIEFSNRAMIEAISSTSPMRGRKNAVGDRADLIILDDYQDEDDVRTEQAREGKWKRYSDDVKYAKQRPIYNEDGKIKKRGTTMIALGTLQSKNDFYDRLRNLPTWDFRCEKGVLVDDVDEFFHTGLWEEFYKILIDKKQGLYFAKEFYYQNELDMQYKTLWNEFWNCLDLSIDYYENPASFKQEVQGNIEFIGERKFKSIATETDKEINSHRFVKTCLVIDPAKTRTKTKNKDYFAFAICSKGLDNNFKYIRKGEIHKFTKDLEYEEYINHTLSLLRKFKDVTHLIIEKNTYGQADSLKLQELIDKDKELQYRDIEILSFTQVQNKDDKINSIVAACNLGQIIFNESDTEAIEQLKSFAGTKFTLHDDFPDVVAEACKKIDEIEEYEPMQVLKISSLFKRR
jgi:hypothetical protein